MRFESLPESHDGSEFTFELHFSEEIEMSFVNMRDDVLDVDRRRGDRGAALDRQGSDLGWQITIVPEPNVDVSISLPPTVDCAAGKRGMHGGRPCSVEWDSGACARICP